ncbi:hypothetical protein MTO96_013680 [Rhipicephalus appendiculatus]
MRPKHPVLSVFTAITMKQYRRRWRSWRRVYWHFDRQWNTSGPGGVDLKQQLEHEDEESTCIAATSLPVENGHEHDALTEQGEEPHAGLPGAHTATEGAHAAPPSYQRNSNEATPSTTHATRHRRGDTQGVDAGTDDEAADHMPGTPSQDAVRLSPPSL